MRTIGDLEYALDYKFRSAELLSQALTHSSHAHEQDLGPLEDNERLEFLGDAILGFLISDFLYQARPNLSEGQLSKLSGFLVSSANLVKYGEQLQLGDYLRLGKGEEKTGGRRKQALLVNAFEAVIAAIYLDGGLDGVQDVVLEFFRRQIEEVSETSERVADFKSALQEELQGRGRGAAQYEVVGEAGPDHQKLFTVAVTIDNEQVAEGKGLTKKAAEQAAAKEAIHLVRDTDAEDEK
jgi:ribonuclease-3